MTTIAAVFRKLYGNLCWNVRRGYGSCLTLEFGQPHLRVREPYQSKASSQRVRDQFAKRLVTVRGDWHLWIYCCDWKVYSAQRVVGDSTTNRRMDRAAFELDGQALVAAEPHHRGSRWRFTFDLGARLETKPYNQTSEQWLLFEPTAKVLSVRADGFHSYYPANQSPDKVRWRPLLK